MRFHFVLAVVAASLVVPKIAAAQVQPSAEVQAAIDRQKERSQRRERGLDAFREELRPLAEAGEPVAQFLIGTMLSPGWDGTDMSGGSEGFDTGDGGGDAGGDGGDFGDGGGDAGGDGGDWGGDGGGFDGGGFDGGGFDFGGFDF